MDGKVLRSRVRLSTKRLAPTEKEGAWDKLCHFLPASCHWAGAGDPAAEWSANSGARGGWDCRGERGLLPAVGG